MRQPAGGRASRRWLAAFAAFFLICAAWAFAAPYDGTPDEIRHVIRAAGVAQGQVFVTPVLGPGGDSGAYQTVPRGLVPPLPYLNPRSHVCYHGFPAKSAACGPRPTGARAPATVLTGAGRYNPVYYAAVGEPLVRWPSWTGLLTARLISAGLCAAFLASAWLSCVQRRRSPLMAGALLVAVPPMAFQLAGAVNPNAVEIMAGISLAAAAIPLLLGDDPAGVRPLLRRAGVAAIVLGQLRAMGPVLLGGMLAVLLIPPARARLRQLAAMRSARLWSAGALLSCVTGIAWTVVFKAADIGHFAHQHMTYANALSWELSVRLPRDMSEIVDGFSYYDTKPPTVILLTWVVPLGILIVAAFVCGTMTERWRLGALIAGILAIPVIVDVSTVNTFRFPFQGRYILPMAAGLPLLAAFIVARAGAFSPRWESAAARVAVVAALPMQLFSLGHVMDRWQSGIGPGRSIDPLAGTWHPVTGSALPLVLMACGLAALGLLAWRATERPAGPGADRASPVTAPRYAPAG